MVQGNDSRIFGLNLRLPEINAAIAKIQIKKLPKFLEIRKKNAIKLSQLIADLNFRIPQERSNESVNWYLYTLFTSKRNKILNKLNSKGIGAASYYPIPIHKTPFYKQKILLPITDRAASHVLSLPIHPKVTSENIEFIAKSLRDVVNE
jgi:dTDP-4-amino-4,6-dideoxygalactose transaminase